ncbi:MAG: hypothetical protein WA047_15495 [Phenylobacterium sp.]|uniref:hypothetical protein n=1 Tax=Phenylobacterium sp. TaxID=1871053 RepID=UPI003BB7356C
MRTLLISATLLALACATPAAAQSYRDAISPSDRGQDSRGDDRDPDRQGSAYDGRGAAPGGGDGYQDGSRDAYGDQGAYRQDSYRPAPRRKARRAKTAVSRYTAAGRPVYYNDGMIRTGRDFPAGTVGRNGY